MWTVITTDVFNEWLEQQDESTQEKVLAALIVLQQQGPSLGRPLVDTVYESKFTNMKELRVQHRGKPLRAFFAFDPLGVVSGNGKYSTLRFFNCAQWPKFSTTYLGFASP